MHPRVRAIVALLVAGLLLSACRGPGLDNVATVNGVEISRELLQRVVAAQTSTALDETSPIPDIDNPANHATTERTFLTLFIRVEIVRQLADELGVLVSDEDVQGRWDLDAASRAGGEDELREFIAGLGLTEAEYRDFELANAARIEGIEQIVGGDVAVTDADIAAAFEASGPVATASHILVETEDEALELKQQLDDGASFADLAVEHSLDTGSAQVGGSLGQQPQGTYVPEFEEYVWSGEIGVISDPIETQFGFHLILVNDRETSVEDATERLRTLLESQNRSQAVQQRFQQALQDAEIVINSAIGRWDADLAEVVSDSPLETPPVTDSIEIPTDTATP